MRTGIVRYAALASVVFQAVLTLILWTAAMRGLAALAVRIDDFEAARAETPQAIEEIHTIAAQVDSLMWIFYPERGQ